MRKEQTSGQSSLSFLQPCCASLSHSFECSCFCYTFFTYAFWGCASRRFRVFYITCRWRLCHRFGADASTSVVISFGAHLDLFIGKNHVYIYGDSPDSESSTTAHADIQACSDSAEILKHQGAKTLSHEGISNIEQGMSKYEVDEWMRLFRGVYAEQSEVLAMTPGTGPGAKKTISFFAFRVRYKFCPSFAGRRCTDGCAFRR